MIILCHQQVQPFILAKKALFVHWFDRMSMNSNNSDDRCQHPDKCQTSFFTYCPHCHLFLCISHLNEHHNEMKNDMSRLINDADHYREFLEEQIEKAKQQQLILNHYYEREIEHLYEMHQFVVSVRENENENRFSLTSEYVRSMKQVEMIKQEQAKKSLIFQIDQILQQQQNPMMDNKEELSLPLSLSSVMDTDETIYSNAEQYVKTENEDEEEDSIVDSQTDNQSDMHSQDTSSLKSQCSLHTSNFICPLATANAFGLSIHKIPRTPCNFVKKSSPLTRDRCFYHLISYHRLKQPIARTIMKTLSSHDPNTLDLTTVDVFSGMSTHQIISQGKSLYIGPCPLTQPNIYGIQTHHKISPCQPRESVHLYHHLCAFHRFKPAYASRLIGALIDNEPFTKELFKSNETIINQSKT